MQFPCKLNQLGQRSCEQLTTDHMAKPLSYWPTIVTDEMASNKSFCWITFDIHHVSNALEVIFFITRDNLVKNLHKHN